jgi:iron(III) transport system permease protein
MTTSLLLEWPGRWRSAGVAALLALPLLPGLSLLWFAVVAGGHFTCGGIAFAGALLNSAVVAVLVALGSLGLGLPLGVLSALYDYRGRRVLLGLASLPLLLPSFLWVFGWRWLFWHVGHSFLPLLTGCSGCVLLFLPGAVALVLFITMAATATLSASAVEAARLAGGEGTLFRQACRHAAVPAVLAALLAAVLTLSDPGPGFAVGLKVAASEILLSFTAFYDYGLAGRECLILALVVLAATLPILWLAAPRLVAERPARQLRPAQCRRHPEMGKWAATAVFAVVLLLTLLPALGLILPVRRWTDVTRACSDLAATGLNTLIYATGAGFCAAVLGFALAFCAGREEHLRRRALGVCLALFALPPMLSALGFVHAAARLPAWTEPALRGRSAVCLALGMRFFPVAALLAFRSWGAIAPSLTRVAGVHGVGLGRYLLRVALPLQRRALVTAVLLVGLLATAEIGMVLLLYPPGEESLPLHVFQIIGYPEPSSRLAALCAVELGLAAGLLVLGGPLAVKTDT